MRLWYFLALVNLCGCCLVSAVLWSRYGGFEVINFKQVLCFDWVWMKVLFLLLLCQISDDWNSQLTATISNWQLLNVPSFLVLLNWKNSQRKNELGPGRHGCSCCSRLARNRYCFLSCTITSAGGLFDWPVLDFIDSRSKWRGVTIVNKIKLTPPAWGVIAWRVITESLSNASASGL